MQSNSTLAFNEREKLKIKEDKISSFENSPKKLIFKLEKKSKLKYKNNN